MVFTGPMAPWEHNIVAAQERIAALEAENARLRELLKKRSQDRHVTCRDISHHWEAWEGCLTYPCPEDRAAFAPEKEAP